MSYSHGLIFCDLLVKLIEGERLVSCKSLIAKVFNVCLKFVQTNCQPGCTAFCAGPGQLCTKLSTAFVYRWRKGSPALVSGPQGA